MNYTEERKKKTYKYLAHIIGYGNPTPQIYTGAKLGKAILGKMKLGKR